MPVLLEVAAPHSYEYSRGTIDWWLTTRFDDVQTELPKALGLEPLEE